jgi:GH15 family glucan-1,4-alpha-glucosidase
VLGWYRTGELVSNLIEDYAIIGDTQTAALVSREGSIDWLCLPRFDSGACFAALLGTRDHGSWSIRPEQQPDSVRRRYVEETLVLETTFTTGSGTVRLVDLMPTRARDPDLVRVVEGVSGRVRMCMDLALRFDYGRSVPWIRQEGGRLLGVAGPDSVVLDTPVELRGEDLRTVAEFEVGAGDRVPFVLEWHPSHESPGPTIDPFHAIDDTVEWWRAWSSRCTYHGPHRDAVARSLLTLKALTYAPTGGVLAAATTSLPEQIGGERNWDYRFCWLRDATFTLHALMDAGYRAEAAAWRDWLLRAVAGAPDQMQIMYGCAGERRLPELTLPWLPGYERSTPVRVGNAAVEQVQLDVYGEVMRLLHEARSGDIDDDPFGWALQRALMEHLESHWRDPDHGIWEVRGPPRDFTHSKVMAWVGADRAVKAVEQLGLDGPVERWRSLRSEIRAEVLAAAWDEDRQTFTMFYGGRELDAALLQMPMVGFLAADDERMLGTVAAIERELCEDGLVHRYTQNPEVDGLPRGEGAFLACTFWLASNQALCGRRREAIETFEHLLELRNDVGLLAEEYDPVSRRQLGNFPQALSHVPLVNTALILEGAAAPAGSQAGP